MQNRSTVRTEIYPKNFSKKLCRYMLHCSRKGWVQDIFNLICNSYIYQATGEIFIPRVQLQTGLPIRSLWTRSKTLTQKSSLLFAEVV